ncbi:MAG: hypothetical protein KBD24_00045 [Candidatus Pacebacteria bacterium]|nr:hypothetical protein [Candidatus Paceibacterota bacterium]
MFFSTFLKQIKRFVHTRFLETPSKLARDVRQESKEFNQRLIEQRFKGAGSSANVFGTSTISDRLATMTYADLHTSYLRSNNPSTRDTLPDSVWGLLAEATTLFAHTEHALHEEDFEALGTLAKEGEDLNTLTLATLLERKHARDLVADHIHIQTLKMQGKRE